MEYCPTGDELLLVDSQLLHRIAVQDVDAAAAIYQDLEKRVARLSVAKVASKTRA